MKKNIFSLFFLCLCGGIFIPHAHSQNPVSTAALFDPDGNSSHFLIKGKLLPFALGDDGALNGSLGVEYLFAKRHSVGLDGNFMTSNKTNDGGGRPNSTQTTSHGIDRNLMLSYRYYFNFSKLHEKGLAPYLGAFGAFGLTNSIYDQGFSVDHWLSRYGSYTGEGIFAGTLLGFKKWKHLGVDINAGVWYRQASEMIMYYDRPQIDNSGRLRNYNFRLGLNFFYRAK